MGLGQSDISQCEVGRGIDRLLEVLPSSSQLSIADSHQSFLQVVIALKICFQGFRIHRPGLPDVGRAPRRELRLDLTRDIPGYFSFQGENVPQVSLVTIRPNVFV